MYPYKHIQWTVLQWTQLVFPYCLKRHHVATLSTANFSRKPTAIRQRPNSWKYFSTNDPRLRPVFNLMLTWSRSQQIKSGMRGIWPIRVRIYQHQFEKPFLDIRLGKKNHFLWISDQQQDSWRLIGGFQSIRSWYKVNGPGENYRQKTVYF